jgi:hypothetical protein
VDGLLYARRNLCRDWFVVRPIVLGILENLPNPPKRWPRTLPIFDPPLYNVWKQQTKSMTQKFEGAALPMARTDLGRWRLQRLAG